MKTHVYSWRVSQARKADLESEARREGVSVAGLLDRITGEWLSDQQASRNGYATEQAAIRSRVMKTVGAVRGKDSALASKTRQLVRERILRRHSEESNASARAR